MTLPPPLILICDHRGEGLAEALQPLGGSGWRLSVAGSLRESRDELAHAAPAVIVLDPLVPGGAAELEAVGARGDGAPEVPVLLVADPGDPREAVRAARSGAGSFDVIHRGAPFEEYLLRIERLHAARVGRGEIEELRHAASHDDRTDLLRPAAFQRRLAEHFGAAQRHRLDLALALVDLDDFGSVNKAYDHTVGDLVIERVGAAIRRTLRAEDVAGRVGGDEFAVLLPYTDKLDAAHVVRRLRDEIAGLSGAMPGASAVTVTASLGFETFDGEDLESAEALRLHAEIALREAKRLGGNRGIYYRSLGHAR